MLCGYVLQPVHMWGSMDCGSMDAASMVSASMVGASTVYVGTLSISKFKDSSVLSHKKLQIFFSPFGGCGTCLVSNF